MEPVGDVDATGGVLGVEPVVTPGGLDAVRDVLTLDDLTSYARPLIVVVLAAQRWRRLCQWGRCSG